MEMLQLNWRAFAVVLDLSKYFDTLNHEILINLLRKNVKDERVVQLIKRYLKSGVMENGVVIDTEEGSPQGGNLSPLLANVYLNEFDREFLKRAVLSACLQSEILNSLALHWEGTEKAFMSEFIRSHGRSSSPD